ncbi:L,D-transpeptidase family protein [Streptacidiphilus cavernicola]|uniref:L,D-transpeptidase family protein n=1 Tax=Streptacidiphilus cavernicola TaxID=3342716 RepID=A0ABV6W1F2_9ACTN
MSTFTVRTASLPVAAAATTVAVLVSTLCTGCAQPSASAASAPAPAQARTRIAAAAAATTLPTATPNPTPSPTAPTSLPPGIGPALGAKVPTDADQILLVTGKGARSPDSTAVLYQRTGGQWQADGTWAAHNALRGWTSDHHESDLRSPIGVFALTDAGGRLPDPGSRLPYHRSSQFVDFGTGFEGESLAGVFDYVIAIDYNRRPGTSPLDPVRPQGQGKGGGIWLHLDHKGPTHGCVSLPKAAMLTLLRTLDPSEHPVVVMGDRAALADA